MKLKTIKIGDRIYDVVSQQEYCFNSAGYIKNYTALEVGEWVLPIISESDKGPGILAYPNAPFCEVRLPEKNEEQYKASSVIDFADVTNMRAFLEKQSLVHELERGILTSPTNITAPNIGPTDDPAMACLKQAIIDKNFDIDKYESRFGANFNNDKRLLSKDKISLPMLVRMCKNTDIKAELILSDASPDVPNPMGTIRRVELTGGGEDEQNDEQ